MWHATNILHVKLGFHHDISLSTNMNKAVARTTTAQAHGIVGTPQLKLKHARALMLMSREAAILFYCIVELWNRKEGNYPFCACLRAYICVEGVLRPLCLYLCLCRSENLALSEWFFLLYRRKNLFCSCGSLRTSSKNRREDFGQRA